MAQTANTQEPTMEEILASIRRIISEDGEEQPKAQPVAAPPPAKPSTAAAKPAPKPAPAPEPEIEDEDEDEDVLELTDIVPDEEPVPPPPRARAPVAPVSEGDVVMVERPAPAPVRHSAVEEAQLISDRVRDQASSSFMQLARNVLVQETADPRSLEHLVQEMLRPMLQHWLNENLPHMVEGLVQQEIERVTRRERR